MGEIVKRNDKGAKTRGRNRGQKPGQRPGAETRGRNRGQRPGANAGGKRYGKLNPRLLVRQVSYMRGTGPISSSREVS
jgi:hypothetical protein